MKKLLIVGMVVAMGLFPVSCDNGSGGGGGKGDGDKTVETVDQKFRGEWKFENVELDDSLITVTETEYIFQISGGSRNKHEAWSEGNSLFYYSGGTTIELKLLDDNETMTGHNLGNLKKVK
jgi:hypothetical protein